ncbi:uncharacterized protein LOC105689282 isoform X1 [Athalia rosae]|uniref:uncharacterized protein LOC105689282 isoform X1 n=2 Tax=Athalia rosae TaxID=37344 RepID=UPI0020346996|nr:uncharacterized protein LOC105689282 isoform X1 [Athalia rosae]
MTFKGVMMLLILTRCSNSSSSSSPASEYAVSEMLSTTTANKNIGDTIPMAEVPVQDNHFARSEKNKYSGSYPASSFVSIQGTRGPAIIVYNGNGNGKIVYSGGINSGRIFTSNDFPGSSYHVVNFNRKPIVVTHQLSTPVIHHNSATAAGPASSAVTIIQPAGSFSITSSQQPVVVPFTSISGTSPSKIHQPESINRGQSQSSGRTGHDMWLHPASFPAVTRLEDASKLIDGIAAFVSRQLQTNLGAIASAG